MVHKILHSSTIDEGFLLGFASKGSDFDREVKAVSFECIHCSQAQGVGKGGEFGSFERANFDLLFKVGFFGVIGKVVFRVHGGWSPILSDSAASNVSIGGLGTPVGRVGGFYCGGFLLDQGFHLQPGL